MKSHLMIALAGAFVLVAAPAGAQQVTLVSKMGAKCLDAEGGSFWNGTRLIGYPCNGGAHQQFSMESDGTIRQKGKCLDASGGAGRDGDQIVLWDCNGGANQRWRLQGNRLVGINGKCVDLKGGSGHWFGNQPAILWSCSGAENQTWYKGYNIAASRLSGAATVQSGALGTLAPVSASAGRVIATGGGNVVAPGGANVIATGGGNVISTGGGNVIAVTP